MNSWARVGMKVVCVREPVFNPKGLGYTQHPELGNTYTIRALVVGHGLAEGMDGILLEEIENPMSSYGVEYGFVLSRFRPLISQEDDISMFKSLLKPTEVPA